MAGGSQDLRRRETGEQGAAEALTAECGKQFLIIFQL